jgi:hypothetical protein
MTAVNITQTRLGRRTVLAMTIAMAALANAARACDGPGLVGLSVIDRETGQPIRTWRHGGRDYIAGQPGARYGLRLANHTGGRLLVVLSVDGVNIYTGETAGYDQGGYVLRPYQSYDVNGWRKSTSEIAAFSFAPLPQSYAARTGRPDDVGVIGMAVFTERVPPPPPPIPYATEPRPDDAARALPAPRPAARASNAPRARVAPPPDLPPPPRLEMPPMAKAPSAPAMASQSAGARDEMADARAGEKLGTAHGAREWSQINLVSFERATPYPQCTRQIEYDSYANLVANGVITPAWDPGHRPRPFPSGGMRFVPDPPDDP